jgi:signal transduction histidine kinase
MEADREQLLRALANLTLNAAQAGAGRIAVDIRNVDGGIRIDVADDGSGISADARASLFQPFAGSARRGSTGLGLTIARDIVLGHGGDIALVHTGPDGTRFRIDLPGRRARHS